MVIETAQTENAAPAVVGALERAHTAVIADLESGGRRIAVGLLEATSVRRKTLDGYGPRPGRSGSSSR